MKAAVCEKYGPPDVLEFREVDKPVSKADEVLIKVHASSVNAADCNTRGLSYIPSGLRLLARLMIGYKKPNKNILGGVIAGEVVEAGDGVSTLKKGDRVYGSGPELGAYAEYACRPEKGALVKIPKSINYKEAAAVPYGALTALHFIRDAGKVSKGQKVLLNGASGGVGVFAVQLAKYFGAEVTGVCSARNIEFIKSLGADHVIDYTTTDFTQNGQTYDAILDVVVGKTSYSRCKNSLEPKGLYLAVAGGINEMLWMLWTSLFGKKKVVFGGGTSSEKKENMEFISELIEKGHLQVALNKTFPFEQIVEAHKYVESGSKNGNIAIQMK